MSETTRPLGPSASPVIRIPELSLVVLIGASGSGKSTFARKHFKPTEILSSDFCRGLVSDDENDQSATTDAFAVLHFIAARRLDARRLTVVDATNVQSEARKPLIELAREQHCLPVAIVLNMPAKLCHGRNANRPERTFGEHVVRQQSQQLRRSLRSLAREGFRQVHVLDTPEEVEAAVIERQPLWNDKRSEHGPFDIIGDVHGCLDELRALLANLGYGITMRESDGAGRRFEVRAPEGRRAIFLGDLVDRGPDTPGVLRLVMSMVESGAALCVPGNHERKLLRKLRGKDVRITHGLAESLEQLEKEPPDFAEKAASFIDKLVSHYVLDDGKLVVAHAGLKEKLQGRASGAVREFAMYGETTGETDEFGLPVRYVWAADYRGRAMVVYGHTPVPEAEWLNRTICIDTGCVFGGKLTALRYPENEVVSVPAARTYYESPKPFLPEDARAPALDAQQREDDLLDIDDVMGKRIVTTGLHRTVTIREENAIAALEVMSRFAVSPKWLIYLPPTMSPVATSQKPALLEHPAEAFEYYLHEGIPSVVCEQKHMGSRAVVVLCQDEDAALRRFGVAGQGIGVCYTRTGRPFFQDAELERALLDRLASAATASGLWTDLGTDWVCLDCELMPWSAKAVELLRGQYAAVGAAARASVPEALESLRAAEGRLPDIEPIAERMVARASDAELFVEAYRRYCWNVASLDDLKIAPFHVMASEGRVHTGQSHLWHMAKIEALANSDPGLILATSHRQVDVTDVESQTEATAWWEGLTASGGEGMVVKPLDFVARGRRGLVQPAVKCRGREYLRIIYGPDYTEPVNLERLRSRALAHKRSLALREFSLGIEALERFVRKEPLRRVHECVFGVLALESEPVDPRL